MRAADGTEQHGIGCLGECHVGVADRLAMRIIGAAADKAFFELERGNALLREPGGDLFDFRHDFDADAVAGKDEKLICGQFLLLLLAGF